MKKNTDIRNEWFLKKVAELNEKGVSKSDMAKSIGVIPQYLTPILNGKRNASENLINTFCQKYNINQKDLYEQISASVGLMTKEEIQQQNKEIRVPEDSMEGIPLIPVNAMAGYMTGEVKVLEYECERYIVPIFREAEFLIPVKGSSMIPKYNSGDLVACKKLPLNDLFFQWNKVYVLDTTQGALVKRIRKGCDNDHILLVSDNENYEPFELHKSKINAVALVVGVMRLE